jgi:integrase
MNRTTKNNISNIRRLYEQIYNNPWNGNLDFLKHKKKVVNTIENSDRSLGGKLTQFKIISAVLRDYGLLADLYEFYKGKMTELIPLVLHINKLNKAKEHEQYLNHLNWKILTTETKDKIESDGTPLEKLLFLLYTEIPPRRTEMAQFLRYGIGKDLKYNYLDLDTNTIILNRWKNAKYKGSDIIKFKPHLGDTMRALLFEIGKNKGDLIFSKKDGSPLIRFHLIPNLFRKYTQFPISTRALRHLFISNFLSTPRSILEIESMANRMGNSPEVFMEYNRI